MITIATLFINAGHFSDELTLEASNINSTINYKTRSITSLKAFSLKESQFLVGMIFSQNTYYENYTF